VVGVPAGPQTVVQRYQAAIHEPTLHEDADIDAPLMELCDNIFADLCAGLRDRQLVLP